MFYGGLIYMIFYTLDYAIEKTLEQNLTAEQIFIRKFTGEKVSRDEARFLQERINDHKWYVSEKLGRDVGLNVAAIDFLENIYEREESGRKSSRGLRRRRGFNLRVYENLSLTA